MKRKGCVTSIDTRSEDQPRQGEHDETGDHGLDQSRRELLDRDPLDPDRREQTVFDLPRELKLRDQRHRHGLDSRQQHRERDDAGQEQALVLHGEKTARRQNPAEHEDEKHRLKQGLHEKLQEVPARDPGVASEQREKRAAQSRRLRPV